MFNIWNKITDFVKKHPWLSEVVVFAIMLVLYLPLQIGSKGFADPDSFYHLKMAELIAAHGPLRNFIWMPFTTLANSFADQHFLYHLALIPFIKLFGPLLGMKLATAVMAALAIAALAWSLRYVGIRFAATFALAAGIMNPLAFRIGLSKASALGVAFLIVGLALAAKKRTWPLAVVAFFYVWTHGSWPALVGLGTVVILVVSFEKRDKKIVIASEAKQSHENITMASMFTRLLRRLRPPRNDGFKSLLALWSGAIAGIIINPFFPQNLKFYWEQIVQIAVINYQGKIGVGAEWYPYLPLRLAHDLPLLCLMAFAAIIIFPIVITQCEENDRREPLRLAMALSFCAGAFLVLTLRSQRHVEYFVPLAVAAVAAWFSEFRIANFKTLLRQNAVVAMLAAAVAFSLIAVYAGIGLARAKKDLAGNYSFTLYEKAAEYLKTHAAPDEIVVNADWDDMPPLFFRDDGNRYIMGLDPTFMYRANPKRYWDYVNFTLGKSTDPVGVMKELDSHYVLADRVHNELDTMLGRSPRFTRVYEDKESEIYLFK